MAQNIAVRAQDGPSVDAFGRWRVSNPATIFASKMVEGDTQALFFDEDLISGTMATSGPTADKPYIDFTSTNVTAGKRTRQTYRRFNYQPGKGQLILMTGVLELASGVKTGCVRQIGLFDDDNGAFFESNAGTLNVVARCSDSGSPVDDSTSQDDWNIDRMDGDPTIRNPSGITLDVSKAQIFAIDFQWLSVGRVRFGFEIGGKLYYVHEHNLANIGTIPWTSTPCLPIRYQIVTTTASGVCSMRCICSSVVSEGGTERVGMTRSVSTEGTAVTCSTDNVVYAIVGIRLKSTRLGANIDILRTAMQIQTASDSGEWILLWNPTVADTFAYGDEADSAIQSATGATANTVTGGHRIDGDFVQSLGNSGGGSGSESSFVLSDLKLGADIAGVVDELVLCFRVNAGASNVAVEGSLTWMEIA